MGHCIWANKNTKNIYTTFEIRKFENENSQFTSDDEKNAKHTPWLVFGIFFDVRMLNHWWIAYFLSANNLKKAFRKAEPLMSSQKRKPTRIDGKKGDKNVKTTPTSP